MLSTVIIAFSAVMLASIVVFLALCALLFVDTTPDPSGRANLLCAPHGRVAAAMVLLRTAIAILYSLAFNGSAWAQSLIDVALGAAWLGLFYWFLPYQRQWLNRVQVWVPIGCRGHLLLVSTAFRVCITGTVNVRLCRSHCRLPRPASLSCLRRAPH